VDSDVFGGFSSAQPPTKFSFFLVNVEHWDLSMLLHTRAERRRENIIGRPLSVSSAVYRRLSNASVWRI
jgi:hypothetical protein